MLQRLLTVPLLLTAAVACGGGAEAPEPEPATPADHIYPDVPPEIDATARYLVYLHGRIIEERGVRPTHPEFGVYEYREILQTFGDRGFEVISEARPEGTDAGEYAARVAAQVTALLDAGVPPGHVTVVGFSKGGGIAILASSLLANDRINFVFMASCGPWYADRPEIVPQGRLLGIREASDNLAGPCGGLFARSQTPNERREIVLDLGGGHGAFFRPRAEWVEPVVEWASVPE